MLKCNQLLIDVQDCQRLLNHSFVPNKICTDEIEYKNNKNILQKQKHNFKINAIPDSHIP